MPKSLGALLFVALSALGFLLHPVPGWSGSDLRPLESGVWTGAVRGDDQGNPESCYLAAQKKNGKFWIILKLDSEGLHVVLYNEGWNLTVGDSYNSRVVIDKKLFGMVDATTPTDQGFDFLIGNDEPSMNSIQAGRRISFSTPIGKKSFRLQGTRKAVDKLLECADKYLDGADSEPHSYQAGVTAFTGKDYEGALRHWQPLAENGDAKSQNAMGILYYNGRGVKKNWTQAAVWFQRAADQGFGRAQNNLGEMYRDGEGVAQNDALAVDLFNKAAMDGVDKAIENMAAMITSGRTGNDAADDATPSGQTGDGEVVVLADPLLGKVSLAGKWETSWGEATIVRNRSEFRGRYTEDNGQLRLHREGDALVGVWAEIDSAKKCNTKRLGTYYWGRLKLDGSVLDSGFTIAWGYCADGLLENGWDYSAKIEDATPEDPPMPSVAQPLLASAPKIRPTQKTFAPDKGVKVRFSGLPAKGQDWLAISKRGDGAKQYFDLIMLTGKPIEGTHRFKPLPAGDYDVRLYINWPDGGYDIVARSAVSIAEKPAAPLPAAPLPSAPLAIPAPAPAQPTAVPLAAEPQASDEPPKPAEPPAATLGAGQPEIAQQAVSAFVCNINWPHTERGCDSLASDQTVKAGPDGQTLVTCKAGESGGLLAVGGTLSMCVLAAPVTLKSRGDSGITVICSEGTIGFVKNGFEYCSNAILKTASAKYECGELKATNGPNKTFLHIACNTGASGAMPAETGIGTLLCEAIEIYVKSDKKWCKTSAATKFVFPKDGEEYTCPAGMDFQIDSDASPRSLNRDCRSNGARFKAHMVSLGLIEPSCREWNVSHNCTQKGVRDTLSLRSGDDTKVVCESGYQLHANGGVEYCGLGGATKMPVPGPNGDMATCSGEIVASKAGLVMDCTLTGSSPVRVTLPMGAGDGVCVAGKLQFFPDGTLKACEEFQTPIAIQTPKINLTCTAVLFYESSGKVVLNYCGFSGAGEVSDSDGNTLICDQAHKMEVVSLESSGAIAVGQYEEAREGFCKLKK